VCAGNSFYWLCASFLFAKLFYYREVFLDISKEDMIMNLVAPIADMHHSHVFSQQMLDRLDGLMEAKIGECCPRNSRRSIPDTPFTLCRCCQYKN